jgi:hypothetical protein
VKDTIGRGLTRLQPQLTECLGYRNGGMMTKIASHARKMRTTVDDVIRYATVPMVQNLVHHLARIVLGVVDNAAAAVAMVDTSTERTSSRRTRSGGD